MRRAMGFLVMALGLWLPAAQAQEVADARLYAELRQAIERLEQQPDDPAARKRVDTLLARLEHLELGLGAGSSRHVELKLFEPQPGATFGGSIQQDQDYDFTILLDQEAHNQTHGVAGDFWWTPADVLLEDQVVLSDGDALHGAILDFEAGALHFSHNSLGALQLEAPQLRIVRFRAAETEEPRAQAQTVSLVSGERMAGTLATLQAGVLVWQPELFEDALQIPRQQVQTVQLHGNEVVEVSARGDRVRCLNGDQLSGMVVSVENALLQLQPLWADGDLQLPLSELAGFSLACDATPAPSDRPLLALRDGSRLSGQWLGLEQDQLTWQTDWGHSLNLQTRYVEAVFFARDDLAAPVAWAPQTFHYANDNVFAARAAHYVGRQSVDEYLRVVGRDVVYLAGGDRVSGVLGASDADSFELQTSWGGLRIERAAVEALTLAMQEPRPQAFLGIRMEDDGGAVRIVQVITGSPAEQAGLLENDRILQLEEQAVSSSESLRSLLLRFGPGEAVQLEVERQGQSLHMPLRLGAREAQGGWMLPPADPLAAEVRQRVIVRSAASTCYGEFQGLFEGAPVVAVGGQRRVYELATDSGDLRLRLAGLDSGSRVRLELDGDGRLTAVSAE